MYRDSTKNYHSFEKQIGHFILLDSLKFGLMAYQPLSIIQRQIHFYTYKTVQFQTIQFSISTVFYLHTIKWQNSSISI